MSDRVDLAVAIVYPLMKDYFKNWDPLKVCVSLIYLQFLFDGLSFFILTFPSLPRIPVHFGEQIK